MTKGKINLITKDLFNTVGEQDVISIEGKELFYKEKVLTDADKKSIISQAKTIQDMGLWKILVDELKYLSNRKMYFDSKTEEDILFAKAMLWTVDVMEKKIDKLSKLK